MSIKTFLSGYRSLIFWLIWGGIMSWMFGVIIKDFRTSSAIFMGLAIYLGLIIQFVKSRWIKIVASCLGAVAFLIIVRKPLVSLYQMTTNQKISRSLLVDDVRQLTSILESAHPDPYIHGGGKIAFHRRMQKLIQAIPEDGLTKTEFYRHLNPFVAAVGDGHTSLWEPYPLNWQSPGGLPFYFQVAERYFYLAGVIDPAHRHLIGSKLISIQNIPVDDLLNRQSMIKGWDNEYQLMRNLGYDGSLWHKKRMEQLIPEWKSDSIRISLLTSEEKEIALTVKSNEKGLDQLITAPTTVSLPSTEKSNYVYGFLDDEKKTALLLMENMYTYRESFEMEIENQGFRRAKLAKELYQKYNGKSPPVYYQDLVAGIPSATELCRELVQAMEAHQTENLLIDLRRNQGGNAFISTIFFYFLYGKEALISFRNKKSIFIRKYSPLFWSQYPAWSIHDINKHQPIKLNRNDYDFSAYPEPGDVLSREEAIRIIEDEASKSSTFWKEYQSEEYSGYYRPKNILILCSPLTYSSGYAFMYDHWAAGGKVVGVPSSQAGNNFGAWVGFQLKHSRLKGGVSHLYITHFREDTDMGRVLQPDYEMTYDHFSDYDFDPNAEILYTMEIIDSLKHQE